MDQQELDEILGITRCERCGHKLEHGEIECPFCSLFPDKPRTSGLPKWIYLTACFLTSPFSIPAIFKTKKLNYFEKALAVSGVIWWIGLYLLV